MKPYKVFFVNNSASHAIRLYSGNENPHIKLNEAHWERCIEWLIVHTDNRSDAMTAANDIAYGVFSQMEEMPA